MREPGADAGKLNRQRVTEIVGDSDGLLGVIDRLPKLPLPRQAVAQEGA
jgi:hypothetical protein